VDYQSSVFTTYTTAGVGSALASIADMVTQYNALLNSADGIRSTNSTASLGVADFAKISADIALNNTADSNTDLNSNLGAEAKLMNSVISGLTTDKVDQVSELITIATAVNKIMQIASGTTQTIGRSELASLGLTSDGQAGHGFLDVAYQGGPSYITDQEFNRFIGQTTGAGCLLGLGVTKVDTWQKLQDILTQAVLNA
jgi:hypothetical protein